MYIYRCVRVGGCVYINVCRCASRTYGKGVWRRACSHRKMYVYIHIHIHIYVCVC